MRKLKAIEQSKLQVLCGNYQILQIHLYFKVCDCLIYNNFSRRNSDFLYAVDGSTFYKLGIVFHHFIVLIQLCQLLTFFLQNKLNFLLEGKKFQYPSPHLGLYHIPKALSLCTALR